MSTTNKQKRREAKKKAREQQARGRARARGRAAAAKERPVVSAAVRFFGRRSRNIIPDPETQREMEHARVAALRDRDAASYPGLYRALAAGVSKDAPKAYIRFGDLPPDERSRIWGPARTTHERGVSVFAARKTPDGHYILDLDNALQHTLTAFVVEGQRPAYVARGRGAGRGINREPLLRDVDLEPLPDDALVVTKTPSLVLEEWNADRFGAGLEDVPGLSRYFEEGTP